MIARLNSDTLQDQRMTQEEAKEQKKSTRFLKKGKKAPSPKFTRTKSGAVISHTKLMEIPQQRSLSPPPNLTQSLPRSHYPPPPSSDPLTLTHHGNQVVKPRSDQGSVTSDDGHHFSDSGSMVSNSSSTRGVSNRKPPLSPTTHVLIVEDQSHSSTETYV